MTESERPKEPSWMRDAKDWKAANSIPIALEYPNVELCRAALIEIFAYMGMELDGKGRSNLESYDFEKIQELMSKIKGLLQ